VRGASTGVSCPSGMSSRLLHGLPFSAFFITFPIVFFIFAHFSCHFAFILLLQRNEAARCAALPPTLTPEHDDAHVFVAFAFTDGFFMRTPRDASH
jgi:hypothetical protein